MSLLLRISMHISRNIWKINVMLRVLLIIGRNKGLLYLKVDVLLSVPLHTRRNIGLICGDVSLFLRVQSIYLRRHPLV